MSAKNLDHRGRWRSKTVAFRVTEEENALIDAFAALSGMTKQDYIIHRLTNRDVVVMGNPRVHKALKRQMEQLILEFRRLTDAAELSEETAAVLEYLARIYEAMKTEDTRVCPQEKQENIC